MSNTTAPKERKKLIRTAAIPSSLYVLLNGQLRFLNQSYDVVGVASKSSLLKKIEEREGIRTVGINIERNISPLKDFVALYQLYRLFRREKPDMVHSITPKAGLLTMIASYFARVPYRLHTFTGLLFPTRRGPMKQVLIFFDRLICWFATHLYPEGKGVKKDLEKYKITAKPLKVIANGNVNGKDMDYYNQIHFTKEDLAILRKKLGILTTDTVFIYVGRLINDKGVNELVDAFCTLSKKQENIKLLMVGSHDGETDILPEKTLSLIEKLDQIICVGQQQDIRPFLALSTIFVFPSYREGFPNVVIEAGAMGLPSIVTDINGSNEIIIHNKNGLIIPSKNTDAILLAMENLSNNKILLEELTKNARPMVVSRYDYNMVWAAQLAEYQSFFK